MKQFRPIVSLILAGIVMLASVGVTLNQHICMGEVRATAVFVKAKNCGMPSEAMASGMKGKGCCDDRAILIKSKTTAALTSSYSQVVPLLVAFDVVSSSLISIFAFTSSCVPSVYACYKPPAIDHDITVLMHSFLI